MSAECATCPPHFPDYDHLDHCSSSLNFGISREFPSNFANRGVRDSRYREGGLAPWVFVAARITYIDL